jgi:hypothetical protein
LIVSSRIILILILLYEMREKCWKCHLVSNDVELRACDDRLCNSCFLANEEALRVLRGLKDPVAADGAVADRLSSDSRTTAEKLALRTKHGKAKRGTDESTGIPLSSAVRCSGSVDVDGIVFNELLMYVDYYRNRASVENIRKVINSFYSCAEITLAKRQLVDRFGCKLPDCEFFIERRNSAQRAASDAEIEDIFGLFHDADSLSLLDNVKFAALAYDRLPRYGPEELNICAVVDKQVVTETKVANLSEKVLDLEAMSTQFHSLLESNIQLVTSIKSAMDTSILNTTKLIQDKLSEFTIGSSQRSVLSNGHSSATYAQQRMPDRSNNIVMSGIPESMDSAVWRSQIVEVLHLAAGRTVQITDAFRLGRFHDSKVRPILVKLHSVWDRRIVLNGSRKLAQSDSFKSVFLSADEPLDIRRRNSLERLRSRAVRDGKHVFISDDGVLSVDGSVIFSVTCGDMRQCIDNNDNSIPRQVSPVVSDG